MGNSIYGLPKRPGIRSLGPPDQRVYSSVMEGDGHTQDPFDITGKRFSHYLVTHRIGVGGMGMVYEAEDERLQRKVALKVLPPWSRYDEKAVARFRREARASSSLNHPNICTVYEFDEVGGRPFIAMELVDGPSLRETISEGPVNPDRAIQIVDGLAHGLAHAHAREIVHRDIKPGNILLSEDGRPKIADFGLARITDASTITRTGATLGTVAYMSPEQANGDSIGPATDIWSLGVVYFEMLMGERPFRGEYPSAVIYSIVNEEPSGLDDLRDRFGSDAAAIVGSCLDKDPAARPSAGDLSELLLGKSDPVKRVRRARKGITRRKLATVASSVLAGVLLLIAAVSIWFGPTSIPLSRASVAIVSLDKSVTGDIELSTGFASSVTRTVKEIAEERGLVDYIVPHDDVVESGVIDAREAAGKLGAQYALVVQETGDVRNVIIALVSTKTGRVIKDKTVAISEVELQAAFESTVKAMISLLGLSHSDRLRIIGPYAPSEPGVFEFYARAIGMVREQANNGVLAGIALLERAVEQSPGFARGYAGLGEAYLILSQLQSEPEHLENARRYCDRAIELDPELNTAYVTLSNVYLHTGMYGVARSTIELALLRDGTSTEALSVLADIYTEQGLFEEAEATYRRIIRHRPGYWSAYRRLGAYYFNRGLYSEAAEQFQYVIDLAPLNAIGYINTGAAYFYMGEYGIAAHYWEQGMEVTEDYALVMNIATARFYAREFDEAARAYEQALELGDDDYRTWGNLGTSLLWAGADRKRYITAKSRAITLAEEALAINPRDDQVRAKLAGYQAEIADTMASLTYLKTFGDQPDPSLPGETVFEVGAAWEAIGERSKALFWIQEALLRNYSTTELELYPGLDSLRVDPVYREMVQSTNSKDSEVVG